MKGGFNNPPNGDYPGFPPLGVYASMKGGFNNPPNRHTMPQSHASEWASMKGGFNNPPNSGRLFGIDIIVRLQ